MDLPNLTRRELEIIALIEEGLSNKEIAARLPIEVPTVKNHIHNTLEKLQLDGRREVARYARERGLLVSMRSICQSTLTGTSTFRLNRLTDLQKRRRFF